METPTIQLDPYSEAQVPHGVVRRYDYGTSPETVKAWMHDQGAVDQTGNMLCCDGCRAVVEKVQPKEVDGQMLEGTMVEFVGPEGHIVPVLAQMDKMFADIG